MGRDHVGRGQRMRPRRRHRWRCRAGARSRAAVAPADDERGDDQEAKEQSAHHDGYSPHRERAKHRRSRHPELQVRQVSVSLRLTDADTRQPRAARTDRTSASAIPRRRRAVRLQHDATRGAWMRGFVLGVIATIVAFVILVVAVTYLGLYPIGADNPPSQLERTLAGRAMNVYADKHKP